MIVLKQRKNFLERAALAADLPGEPLPKVPLVELAGERRVLIENHGGVTEYGGEEIRVKVAYGQVCVCGMGLELARMTREQLVITGRIDGITLLRGRV